MVHHIAELIQAAESEIDPAKRSRKEEKAAETITRLWTHRSKYENRVNPVWELRPILQVLRTLDPEQNIWISYSGAPGREGLRHLYDAFRRLIILMIVRKVPADKIKAAVDSAGVTAGFQDPDEREVVASIDHWLTESQRKSVSGEAPRQNADDEDKQSLEEIARSLIAEARKALDAIEAELEKPPEVPGPPHRRTH
jgi:hypothetical protein